MCGPRKHNSQPFCGPEGQFDCSYSVFSLRPAPLSYLCVGVRIGGGGGGETSEDIKQKQTEQKDFGVC